MVAAAVILNAAAIPAGLDDSKALDPAQRKAAYARILATARVGVGPADVGRIDRENILAATLWPMAEAVRALGATRGSPSATATACLPVLSWHGQFALVFLDD